MATKAVNRFLGAEIPEQVIAEGQDTVRVVMLVDIPGLYSKGSAQDMDRATAELWIRAGTCSAIEE